MSLRCAYEDCFSAKYPCSRIAFFRLPNDERRSSWIRNSGNKSLLKIGPKSQRFFCENHFRTCDINSQFHRKLLKRDAVPIAHKFLVNDKVVSAEHQHQASVHVDGSTVLITLNKNNHENTGHDESLEENTDYENLYDQTKLEAQSSTPADSPADEDIKVPYHLLDFCDLDDFDDEPATTSKLEEEEETEKVETNSTEKPSQEESLEIYFEENSSNNQVDSSTLELVEDKELNEIETLDDDITVYAAPVKKKRPNEPLTETPASENVQLPPVSNNISYEEDKHFALSLVGYFQRLPRGKKALAKLKILQYLTELEVDSQPTCL